MKTFAVRNGMLSVSDNERIGGDEHNRHRQGTIFVKAAKKADALELLRSLSFHVTPTACKIGMGDDLKALETADVLREGIAYLLPLDGPTVVAEVTTGDGTRTVRRIGIIERRSAANNYTATFVPDTK